MAEKEPKPEGPAVQVIQVPEHAMHSVAEFLKNQKMENPDPRLSGTGCRHTTHGDLHCGDTDQV
jgi:hypothetical protein